MDKFDKMSEQQQEFIELLSSKGRHPSVPVDMTTKDGQIFVKSIIHECVGELFEVVNELKNSKAHRATNITEFNRENLKEELADVLHYYFGILSCTGISPGELFDAYMIKGQKNIQRVLTNY